MGVGWGVDGGTMRAGGRGSPSWVLKSSRFIRGAAGIFSTEKLFRFGFRDSLGHLLLKIDESVRQGVFVLCFWRVGTFPPPTGLSAHLDRGLLLAQCSLQSVAVWPLIGRVGFHLMSLFFLQLSNFVQNLQQTASCFISCFKQSVYFMRRTVRIRMH